jgi:hypothetical protein
MLKTMKRIKIFSVVVAMTLIISGCAGEVAPTIDPADLQLTAAAMAVTFVAETQTAAPTDTPLPPTETASPTSPPTELLPTDTPMSLPTVPTLQATSTTAPVINPGPDPCLSSTKRIPSSPAGRPTTIRIINSNKTTVNVSLYLNKTPHGECGYRAYIINSQSEIIITNLVQGCYNLWARSSDPNTPVNAASKTGCINSPDQWTFEITEDKIKFLDL